MDGGSWGCLEGRTCSTSAAGEWTARVAGSYQWKYVDSQGYAPSYAYGGPVAVEGEEEKVEKRGLFEVFLVDPEEEHIVEHINQVFAGSEEMAKLKAISKVDLSRDLDDYDIIVHRLGDVRAKKER